MSDSKQLYELLPEIFLDLLVESKGCWASLHAKEKLKEMILDSFLFQKEIFEKKLEDQRKQYITNLKFFMELKNYNKEEKTND